MGKKVSMQKKLKISPALRNVVKISGGTILGQAISIVTLPIITRMYGAEIMGIWATILYTVFFGLYETK